MSEDPELQEVLRRLLQLSKNELVSLCHRIGVRAAHKGMSKKALVSLLEGEPPAGEDPVDRYRREVMDFLDRNRNQITLSCHGNCFLHSGAKVIQCYTMLKKGRKS